jgi:hypothetical protein
VVWDVVLSVHVTVPVLEPVVIGTVAVMSSTTTTAPADTPETPVGVKVGAPDSHVVPDPKNVHVVVVFVAKVLGDTERDTVPRPALYVHATGAFVDSTARLLARITEDTPYGFVTIVISVASQVAEVKRRTTTLAFRSDAARFML